MTFKVAVEFLVEAEPLEQALQQWTPEQCAFDYVKHRIDEGLLMEDHIKTWNCISIKPTYLDE